MKPTKVMFMDDEQEEAVQSKPKAPVKKKVEEPEGVAPSENARVLDLPSKGMFGYPASVEYRDMLAKDEELLASATGTTYVRTLNGIIKSVLNNCSWYEKLTTYDRDYVMIWLWANNYNPMKTVSVTCNGCGHVDKKVKVDLTDLEIDDPQEGFTGAFKMTLASTGKPVVVRLNTVADEIAVEQYLSKHEDAANKYEYLMRVASVDVGIELALEKKMEWVGNNVNTKEMAKIKEFHKRFRYGVKTRLDHVCSECSEVTQFDLPFSAQDILFPDANMGDMEFDFV